MLTSLYSIFAGLLTVLVLICPARAQTPLRINGLAPTFAAMDTQHRVHRLQDYQDKIVVLEWTSHECPYTAKHYESQTIQNLQKFAAENDVIWLSIVSAGPGEQGYADAALAETIKDQRGAVPHAVLLDPKGHIGRLYNAKVTPQFYILNPKGYISYMGAIDSASSANWGKRETRNFVQDALVQMISGQAVTRQVTRPYGCAIKYAPVEGDSTPTESLKQMLGGGDRGSEKNQPPENPQAPEVLEQQ